MDNMVYGRLVEDGEKVKPEKVKPEKLGGVSVWWEVMVLEREGASWSG